METFGQKLRQYRNRSRGPSGDKPLTQEQLAEFLSQVVGADYSGAAISNWETGKNNIARGQRRVLVALLQILRRYQGLETPAHGNELLWAGDHRSLDEVEHQQVFPDIPFPGVQAPAPDTTPLVDNKLWPRDIPDERYYPLPGRERHLSSLLQRLEGAKPTVIAIDGLGGLGKTALATELARRALRQGDYAGVVGDSAKQEIFTGGEIIQLREAVLDFDSLLDAIARQLEHWEITTFRAAEKQAAVAYLLQQRRFLVLVDNLETAENANALVVHLSRLLGGSQIIITSRNRVPHDFVHTLSLVGLDQTDALLYLYAEADYRGVPQILQSSEQQLKAIFQVAGGAPLALKLVVAQAQFLDLDLILRQLQRAGSRLYPFIFRQSWDQLSMAAQYVLIYIGRTVVTSVSWEELASVGLAESEEALLGAIEQLIAYSLLESARDPEQTRYSIHPLTRQFVNSDLPRLWREDGSP